MSIDEIKTISIVDYLRSMGHTPTRHYRDRYWYRSPLHEEKVPSFKVDMDLNLWYDFGWNTGGNIITLVQKMNPGMSMHDILLMLEKSVVRGAFAMTATEVGRKDTVQDGEKLFDTVIQRIGEIRNGHLLEYLKFRRIPVDIAREYCKEIHYTNKEDRPYYGIGFENIAGGWEIRNRYYKRSIGIKQISFIPLRTGSFAGRCCLFEGFFDFLSYRTLQRWPDTGLCIPEDTDYLILNSVSMVPKALALLENYAGIHCYLDNDDAGRKATGFLMQQFEDKAKDESWRFEGFNDVNEILTGQ